MLTDYSLKMPKEVYGGEHALEKLKDVMSVNDVKKVAVFTDHGIRGTGLLELPMQMLTQAGVETVILDDLPAEPTYSQVQVLVDAFRAEKADIIVAVGGGSVMDAAKLAAVPEKELKIGIVNEEMMADYVILDVRMVAKLPRKIAAATGVDALAHAIECWTSNKANPFSGLFAMHALDLLLNNLLPACNEQDMQARQNVQLASFLAGVAITASGTTAVHALSYPLGGKYHIAHGISNAILLAPVMRFNEPACRALLAQAYDTCVHGEKTCETQAEKSSYIIAWLEKIVKDLDIPTSLSVFSVPAEDLESLVEAGLSVKRLLNNNMREVTADDAREIYRSIL